MAYRKRYEDSYLDEEENELEDVGKTDAERIIGLMQKKPHTSKDDEKIKLLTTRLLTGAKLPGPSGADAQGELVQIAEAYRNLGKEESSVALWAQISDIATLVGNKELYYKSMENL